jgi:hypothetical protein
VLFGELHRFLPFVIGERSEGATIRQKTKSVKPT